jgi:hypothetical protein
MPERSGPGALASAPGAERRGEQLDPSLAPPQQALETVAWSRQYHHRGWPVLPIPPGCKAPVMRDWQHFEATLEDLPRLFRGGQNIGVILDAPLADVDLDCAEAIALADRYLPATRAMFGRPSKPRSHRVFLAPNAVYESFVDPHTGHTLLELRAGSGHQTLFPPSITDGERREWYGDVIAPRPINAELLRAAVAWLAVGCLVGRHVSRYAAERPDPDFVQLLDEIDVLDGYEGKLGQAARRWLGMPDLGAPKPKSTQWRERDRKSGRSDRTELDLAELAAAIPNDEDWIGWNRLGLAFYAASDGDGDGFAAFDRWSCKSPKYDPRAVAERWRNYHRSPPTQIGVGSLVHFARQQGWTSRTRSRARR